MVIQLASMLHLGMSMCIHPGLLIVYSEFFDSLVHVHGMHVYKFVAWKYSVTSWQQKSYTSPKSQ